MKLSPGDKLLVQYGDAVLNAVVAFSRYCSNSEYVKVMLEGDRYPKTIKKSDIIKKMREAKD